MKVVEFTSIAVENFKSYRGQHVLDISAYSDGLHFVKGRNRHEPRLGSNGAGKSTLWADAPAWCLYGKTPGGLRGTDVRPWGKKTKGPTAVTVSLLIDGKERTVTRSIHPSLLQIDGSDASQESIDKLIGMPQTLFENTVLMGQGSPLFFDLKPRDKMALFVDALGLGRWDDRSKVASARASELAMLAANIEGEITGLKSSLKTLESYIEQQQSYADDWDKQRRRNLKAAHRDLESATKKHTAVQKARDTADLALEAAETELRHYERKLPGAEELLGDLLRKRDAEQDRIDRIKAETRAIKREMESIGDGGECQHCGQSLKGTSLERHQQRLQAKLIKLRKEADDGIGSSVAQEVKAAQVQVRHLRQMRSRFTEEAVKARDALESQAGLFATAEANLKAARKAVAEFESEENPYSESIADMHRKVKQTRQSLADAKADLRATQAKAERAKFWVKGFKDVRLFVMEEVLRELELTTNAMLEDAGLVGWRVEFDMEREGSRGAVFGLSVLIMSPVSAGKVKWESWSGGEAQRLRLVSALALKEVLLNRAGVDPVLEVLDEPTRGLSAEGIADLLEYLDARARRLRLPVFLIDHHAVESTRIASVTTVIRDAKGSRLRGP